MISWIRKKTRFDERTYAFRPLDDITAFELAKIVKSMSSGPLYEVCSTGPLETIIGDDAARHFVRLT